jgi:hypothetical protein
MIVYGANEVDRSSAPEGAAQQGGCVRAMTLDDLPQVSRMFLSVFRGRASGRTGELETYLQALCFGSPLLSQDNGSLVHQAPDGALDGVLLSIPMSFLVDGRPVLGRLLCSYMSFGRSGLRAAAALNRHFRGVPHGFLFSDTSSAQSSGHWRAAGGETLAVESLDWQRVFRPMAALETRLRVRLRAHLPAIARFLSASPSALTAPLTGLVDRALRRVRKSLRAPETNSVRIEAVDTERFRKAADDLLSRFRVRPNWLAGEFSWLCEMAGRNPDLGDLHLELAFEQGAAAPFAAFAYCGRPGGRVAVLNLIAGVGREDLATAALLGHLDRQGFAQARGIVNGANLVALQMQRRMTFRHRGFFCFSSHDEAVREAARSGDLYAGGLASESWSRLVTGFPG